MYFWNPINELEVKKYCTLHIVGSVHFTLSELGPLIVDITANQLFCTQKLESHRIRYQMGGRVKFIFKIDKILHLNEIMFKHQYGFWAGHNTSHPVLHLIDKIYIDMNSKPFTIFIDLKRHLTLLIIKLYWKRWKTKIQKINGSKISSVAEMSLKVFMV